MAILRKSKTLLILIYAAALFTAAAQSPVTLTVDLKSPKGQIPKDFFGVSFGPSALQSHIFDSSSRQLLSLFDELGIKYFRMGGTMVDTNNSQYTPSTQDIDGLFHFVKAAGLHNVIYTLQLENGDPSRDASTADYIWKHYGQDLTCFAIGNEPNLYKGGDSTITGFPSYLSKWRTFAATIKRAVPQAKLGGPDVTGTSSWTAKFANAETGQSNLTYFLIHWYVGGNPHGMTAQQMIDQMLSPEWDAKKYPAFYKTGVAPGVSGGFPFRITEANDFTAGKGRGIAGGNDGFATALFALDFLYWWAEHGCAGVSVHTGLSNLNGIVHRERDQNWEIYPISYGIKAFDVGGHGRIVPVTSTNPDGLNLTAYAASATNSDVFVTIINKEHGPAARKASVTITFDNHFQGGGQVMFLEAPNGNVEATNGVTLGGASIASDVRWHGQWTALSSITNGGYTVTVPAASAAIVKLSGH